MEVLAASPRLYQDLVNQLGPEGLTKSLAPGKWPVSSILCHLADAELAFGFRMRQAVAEENHVTQPWDQDKWSAPYAQLSGEAALQTFVVTRTWNLAWLRTLSPDALSRPFLHPERGPMTVQSLVDLIAGHDLNHLQQVQTIAARS